MVKSTIINYIKENNRIVIPDLGAFVRSQEKVVFMELLKSDDGVLVSLLGGGVEAYSKIEKFSNKVHESIQQNGEYPIGELGSIVKGKNGSLMLISETPIKKAEVKQKTETEIRKVPEPKVEIQEKPKKSAPKATQTEPQAEPTKEQKKRVTVIKAKPKYDIVMVLAGVAVALALFALVYGLMFNQEPLFNLDTPSTEEASQTAE